MCGFFLSQCPTGEVAVQKRHRQLESDGCSKPTGLQVAGEEDFTYDSLLLLSVIFRLDVAETVFVVFVSFALF